MTVTLRPTTDLVAWSWLTDVVGIANVGPQLPSNESQWSEAGYVQVMTVGGSPDLYSPIAEPVVQLDCWAVSPNSGKAPWNKANYLAEVIRAATYDPDMFQTAVALPGDYPNARILSCWLLSEPRRMYGGTQDEASYARYTFDMECVWITP